MQYKYNIAFTPITIADRQQFIRYAESLAQHMPPFEYMLGDKSIPHLTLCHFEADESAHTFIWQQVMKLPHQTLELTFKTRRGKTYPPALAWSDAPWVSLIPEEVDSLHNIHHAIATIVKNPTNLSYADYDPHLTLLNSKNNAQCEQLNVDPAVHPPLTCQFMIALGRSDAVGQLTELLHIPCIPA
jgi:hypothetical protein